MPTCDGIRLRSFVLADARTVAAYLDGPGLGVPVGRVGARWAERLIGDPRVQAWVAVRSGAPVGFARLDVGPDRIAELTLAIASACRRNRVGTAVLGLVMQQARRLRVRRVQAVVDPANVPALAFFAENGFEEAEAPSAAKMFVRWIHDADREVLEIEG